MKRSLACLLALLLLINCPPARAEEETRLMVVSDLHYLAKELYAGSSLFLRSLRNADGKITQEGDALLSALGAEIRAVAPDALIVTGDLTFNGEKESHLALSAFFHSVEAAGVPVWVIPGNHDINVASPVGFADNLYYGTAPVTEEEFAQIYADFLLPGTAGFSYAAPINDRVTVAMVDVSYYRDGAQTFGVFTAGHGAWLEQALRKARAEGRQVVCATHHSLLPHTEFARENFLMFGHETMAEWMRAYGVALNVSGHLHIQHIVQERGLTDAALGAFCIWPHRYALLELDGEGGWRYEAKSLSAEYLPEGFLDYSREWFLQIARDKTAAGLTDATPEEACLMADFAARFNLAYFSGEYRRSDGAWQADPAWALWEKQQNSAFWRYMRLVMNEAGENALFCEGKNRSEALSSGEGEE